MSNEKKTKKDEKKVPLAAPKMGRAGYLGRPTSLMGAVTLSSDLLKKKPVGMGPAVEVAFEDLKKANAVGKAGQNHQEEESKAPIAEPRNGAIGAYLTLTGGLDVLVKSGDEPLASQAREVAATVFGEKRPVVTALGPRELNTVLERVSNRLTGAGGQRKQLEALVHPGLVKLLLDRYAALDAAVEAMVLADSAQLDAKRVTAIVNDAINHYAICVLATARPGDTERSEKAEALLRPILTHRADLRRRLTRRGTEEAEVEAEAVDEPEPEPATVTTD